MNIRLFLDVTVLRAPGMEALKICLSRPRGIADGVSVWEWSGNALEEGAQASKWFSDYLGKPSRLVRFNTGGPLYMQNNEKMFYVLPPK